EVVETFRDSPAGRPVAEVVKAFGDSRYRPKLFTSFATRKPSEEKRREDARIPPQRNSQVEKFAAD
ncbi:MAG: hypothetical protein AAFP90_13730, partial [Planctomycetota bacterium]